MHCRAYPDEKGIETFAVLYWGIVGLLYCRAYPDEKGIETHEVDQETGKEYNIAEPIPMKRELKQDYILMNGDSDLGLQSLSR